MHLSTVRPRSQRERESEHEHEILSSIDPITTTSDSEEGGRRERGSRRERRNEREQEREQDRRRRETYCPMRPKESSVSLRLPTCKVWQLC